MIEFDGRRLRSAFCRKAVEAKEVAEDKGGAIGREGGSEDTIIWEMGELAVSLFTKAVLPNVKGT